MKRFYTLPCSLFAALAVSEPVFAYVGPGAGLTLLGSLWGLILAVVFVLVGIVLLPLRVLQRRRKARKEAEAAAAEPAAAGTEQREAADDSKPDD